MEVTRSDLLLFSLGFGLPFLLLVVLIVRS